MRTTRTPYLGGYSSTQAAAGQANEVDAVPGHQERDPGDQPERAGRLHRAASPARARTPRNCCTTIDPAAVAAAAGYDDVIVVRRHGPDASSGTTGAEDRDRTAITLPGQQGQLIAQVAAVNPNTIAYMETIGPQDVTSFEPTTSAILWSSYNGMRKGEALADVLLGELQPERPHAGIWYQNERPDPADHGLRDPPRRPERPHVHVLQRAGLLPVRLRPELHDVRVLEPAGLEPQRRRPTTRSTSASTSRTRARATATRSSQLYASTPNADPSLERPIKRLEGFQKVFLTAGQTKTVTLPIKIADLAFLNDADKRFEVDQGAYGIQISTSSADGDIQRAGHDQRQRRAHAEAERPHREAADRGERRGARHLRSACCSPRASTIDPGLTVSMNDDTLYGWIAPGQSKPLPGRDDAQLLERPAGRRLGRAAHDVIRTVANGAATITATATYNGASASTSFVVRVLSELGRPRRQRQDGARASTRTSSNYDVIVPAGVTRRAARERRRRRPADGRRHAGGGVPGTATVTSTGPDGIAPTYTVNFAPPATSDEFDGAGARPEVDGRPAEPGEPRRRRTGSLTITPETGDLTTTTNTAKNLVLQPALGDWTLTTKLTFNATPERGHAAGRDHRLPGRRQLPEVRPRGDVGDQRPVQTDDSLKTTRPRARSSRSTRR